MGFFTEQASGGDYIKFDDSNINDPVEMEVAGKYQIRQKTYQGKPSTIQGGPKAGQPVWEAVVPVMVKGELKSFSDGGRWRLSAAVGNAVMAQGAEDLEIGGKLIVTYLGKVAAKGGMQAGNFKAEYVRAPEGSPLATPDFDPRTAAPAVPHQAPTGPGVPAYGQAGGGQPQGNWPQGGYQDPGASNQHAREGGYGQPQGGYGYGG